MEVNGAHEPFG